MGRMEKIIPTEHLRNIELLLVVKWEWNILQKTNEERLTVLVTSCVGTAYLKHVIEGKAERRI
jgi:hypothetical protein